MPSQRYLNEAIQQISEYIYILNGPFDKNQYSTTINIEDKQTKMTNAAANLNQAIIDLIISTRTSTAQDLAKTSTYFTQAFGDFIHNGIDLINYQQNDDKRTHIITLLKNIHTLSNQFLEKVKFISIEPIISITTNTTNQQLSNLARTITDSINHVIIECLTSKMISDTSMNHIECENAIREMETSKIFLEQSILLPCNNHTYYEVLDHIIDNSKRLGEAMTHIASASKNSNHPLFIQAVQDASKAVCHLAESSAQVEFCLYVVFIFLDLISYRQVILLA